MSLWANKTAGPAPEAAIAERIPHATTAPGSNAFTRTRSSRRCDHSRGAANIQSRALARSCGRRVGSVNTAMPAVRALWASSPSGQASHRWLSTAPTQSSRTRSAPPNAPE
jgi:hypothetical protein